MDPSIKKYKTKGKVALWKINGDAKNYPGWHISFDEEARQSIFDLLQIMNNSEWSSKKEIDLVEPEKVGQKWIHNCGGHKAMRKLVISNRIEPKSLFRIKAQADTLGLEFGENTLAQFSMHLNSHSFDTVMSTNEDKSENLLTFW